MRIRVPGEFHKKSDKKTAATKILKTYHCDALKCKLQISLAYKGNHWVGFAKRKTRQQRNSRQ